MKIKASNVNQPSWKPITVRSNVPAELSKLTELAHNMWWAWNHNARSLFRNLDEKLFEECGGNPVLLLENLSFEKMEKLAKDKAVIAKMKKATVQELMPSKSKSVLNKKKTGRIIVRMSYK